MKKRLLIIPAVAAVALGGTALASADDQSRAQASKAALAATGGGTVTGFERDSENGATYEVEVTKPGSQVDVRLDDRFEVVVIEADGD